MTHLVGYVRVSTSDQTTQLQMDALIAHGVAPEDIHSDSASGAIRNRPGLQAALKDLREGDILVIWKLDRLSRSLTDLLTILERLDQAGVQFQSLTESIDTTTASGRAMMKMVGVFAEFEREIIRERTKAGLLQARREGRVGGRPRRLTKKQEAEAVAMIKAGKKSKAEIARIFGCHPSTITRLKVS